MTSENIIKNTIKSYKTLLGTAQKITQRKPTNYGRIKKTGTKTNEHRKRALTFRKSNRTLQKKTKELTADDRAKITFVG